MTEAGPRLATFFCTASQLASLKNVEVFIRDFSGRRRRHEWFRR
jgi:hypothetical protein